MEGEKHLHACSVLVGAVHISVCTHREVSEELEPSTQGMVLLF